MENAFTLSIYFDLLPGAYMHLYTVINVCQENLAFAIIAPGGNFLCGC